VSPVSALRILEQRLGQRRSLGLERRLTTLGPRNDHILAWRGRDLLVLASNDYLGLSTHPRLAAAAAQASQEQGTGSGASRLVSGTLAGHSDLERRIAAFKGTPAALFFPTGYHANLGAVAGLAGPGDIVLSDALNHASIVDACRLSRANVLVYPHGDWLQAEHLLNNAPGHGLRLIVTDGVFSMDGDLAPLPELLALARRAGTLLVVDDAHATGVWGQSGRGSLEHFGLEPVPEMVLVGTFSKALGGLGGFVAGSPEVIDTLINQARSFIYTTAPPPGQTAAAAEALLLVDQEPWRRSRVMELADLLRAQLLERGFRVLSSRGPIIPVLVGEPEPALRLGQALLERGVFAPAIRPPSVPPGGSRLRLTVTAAHDEKELDFAARALSEAAQEAGL
jgi:8-amino-7-oxononanoate synthase